MASLFFLVRDSKILQDLILEDFPVINVVGTVCVQNDGCGYAGSPLAARGLSHLLTGHENSGLSEAVPLWLKEEECFHGCEEGPCILRSSREYLRLRSSLVIFSISRRRVVLVHSLYSIISSGSDWINSCIEHSRSGCRRWLYLNWSSSWRLLWDCSNEGMKLNICHLIGPSSGHISGSIELWLQLSDLISQRLEFCQGIDYCLLCVFSKIHVGRKESRRRERRKGRLRRRVLGFEVLSYLNR